MNDGKHCPNCGKDIGIWPIFSAGLPNRIWCPHCKVRLAYREIMGLCVLLTILSVMVGATTYYMLLRAELIGMRLALVFIGIMLAFWVPAEFVVANYLRGNYVLKKSDSE